MSRHEHVLRRPRRQRRHKHAFLDGLQAVKPLGDHQVARALGLRVHERCETPERGSKHASAAARVPAHVISPALLTKERRCAAKERRLAALTALFGMERGLECPVSGSGSP